MPLGICFHTTGSSMLLLKAPNRSEIFFPQTDQLIVQWSPGMNVGCNTLCWHCILTYFSNLSWRRGRALQDKPPSNAIQQTKETPILMLNISSSGIRRAPSTQWLNLLLHQKVTFWKLCRWQEGEVLSAHVWNGNFWSWLLPGVSSPCGGSRILEAQTWLPEHLLGAGCGK